MKTSILLKQYWQKTLKLSILIILSSCFSTSAKQALAPQYDSERSRQLVDKMLSYHGGKDSWHQLKTLGFTHHLFIANFPKHLNPWWISDEQFQRKNRRGFQYYPLEESLLVFKNGETWSQNWRLPNPPGMMPFFNYKFVFLPWLALEDGASIVYSGERTLPKDESSYPTVKLQFDPRFTANPRDYLRLFIDAETGQLKGVEYNSTYAPMLDQMKIQGDEFGPGFHVYHRFKTANGLKVPAHYSTYFNNSFAGTHAITNVTFDSDFDEEKAHRKGEFIKDTAHPTKRQLSN